MKKRRCFYLELNRLYKKSVQATSLDVYKRQVLTPVGLLPIAVAGFDVKQLVAGAADMEKACGKDVAFEENPAAIYLSLIHIFALLKSGLILKAADCSEYAVFLPELSC